MTIKERLNKIGQAFSISNLNKKPPAKFKSLFPQQNFNEKQVLRIAQTVADWRCAIGLWEDVADPDKSNLLDIYNDTDLDCHITSVVQTRKSKVLNKSFKIVDENGEIDEKSTQLFRSKWFKDFVSNALDATYWGYTLVALGEIKNDKFTSVKTVNRYHVDPIRKIIVEQEGDTTGLDYTQSPASLWMIPVGDEREFGLYGKVSLMYIYKKWALNAWNEFVEMFGQPVRIGKTDIEDDESKQNMIENIRDMGANMWGVFGKDDEIDFVEAMKVNGETVYENINRFIDQQISKAVVGQTMTSDDGSSQSQATVHESILDGLVQGDSIDIEFLVNDELVPRMRSLGFSIPEGSKFMYNDEEVISSLDRSTIDKNITDMGMVLDPDYIEEQYKVKLDTEAMEARKAAEETARASAASKDIENLFSSIGV